MGEASEANEDMEFYGVQDGIMDNDMNAGNFIGMHQTCISLVKKRRRIKVPKQVAQLNEGLKSKISEYEIEEDEEVIVEDLSNDGV